MLRKARVVQVHPDRGTCDIVFLDNGVPVAEVEVVNGSSTAGCSWSVANVPPPSSQAAAAGIEGGLPILVAYCGFLGARPVILAFSRSHGGITVKDQNRRLDVHDASGGYTTTEPDGTLELFVAGGGYLRIGTGPHAPLAGALARGAPASSGPPALTVTLATPSGTLTLAPSGQWTLTGANLTVDCNTTINGSLTVRDDAVIHGIDFLTHRHGGVETGGGDTAGPL